MIVSDLQKILSSILPQNSNKFINSVRLKLFNIISSSLLFYIQNCLPILLQNKKADDIDNLFEFLTKNSQLTTDLLNSALLVIFNNLVHEPKTYPSIQETLDFYLNIKKKHFVNFSQYDQLFQNELFKYVDQIDLAKDIANAIHKQSFESGDITNFLNLLYYMKHTDTFNDIHLQFTITRLQTSSPKQIEIENKIATQLQSISSKFNTTRLLSIIKEAQYSIEFNVGPILIFNINEVPYVSPFPSPILLSSYSLEVSKKYQKFYPSKHLVFPINLWIVHIYDVINEIEYIGSGIQAEIFLHLNSNDFITIDSLEPQIQRHQIFPHLESMTSFEQQVLTQVDDYYLYNSSFNAQNNIVRLKIPTVQEEANARKIEFQESDPTVDCAILEVLKKEKKVILVDLITQVQSNLSRTFTIDCDGVKKRVKALIARGYVEEGDNSNIIYVPSYQ